MHMLSKWCCKSCPEFSSLILRIVVGSTFIIHGSQKVFGAFGGGGISGVANFLTQLGFPAPGLFAYVLALTEFLGGIAVFLGICTQLFALLLAFVMAVAIFTVHLKNGFFGPSGFEYPMVLGSACLALVCSGCTKWGLDCVLHKKCCGTD